HASAERCRRKREQLARVRLGGGPYDGHAPIGQRQECENPVPPEPLKSDIAVRSFAAEVGDDAELIVALALRVDSRRDADPGLGAVGAHHQPRPYAASEVEPDLDPTLRATHLLRNRRADHREISLALQAAPESVVQPGGFDGRA